MSQAITRDSSRSLSETYGSNGKTLPEIEAEVDRSVQGLEEALNCIGQTLNEKKPQEADLLAGVGILHSHIKSVSSLMEEVGDILKEKQQEERVSKSYSWLFCHSHPTEVALDVVSLGLNVVNNVIKTADFSSTSAVGWASVGLNVLSTVFSKSIDKKQAEELSRQKTKTKLHKMVARLSIVERAHTMAKLFKLFELLRRGETVVGPNVINSGLKECRRIPEPLKQYVNPEGMAMQLIAVANIDLTTLNTSTNLGRTVARVIERQHTAHDPMPEEEEIVEVGELVRRWNDASYQIKTTLHGVDALMIERLQRPGQLHFNPMITILNRQIAKLKMVSQNVDKMIHTKDQKPTCCSYKNRFFAFSVVETAMTIVAITSYIFFNLISADSVTGIWVSGMVLIVGPLISKVNKYVMKRVIEEEVNRQELIKMREEHSFIESTETFVITLQAIQDAQEDFAPEKLSELLEVCRTSGYVKDYVSEDVMRGVVTKQVKDSVSTDVAGTRYVKTMEERAYTDITKRKSSRERIVEELDSTSREREFKRKGTIQEEKIELTIKTSSKTMDMTPSPVVMRSNSYKEFDEISDLGDSDDEGVVSSRITLPPCFKRQTSDHVRTRQDELLAQFAGQIAMVANRESPDTPQKYLSALILSSDSKDAAESKIKGDDAV